MSEPPLVLIKNCWYYCGDTECKACIEYRLDIAYTSEKTMLVSTLPTL